MFGDVKFRWAEGEYVIRFSYQAIDAVEREFGENWSERLRDLFVGTSKKDLELVASLTTGRSVADIQAASPPIVPLVNALYKAWQLAWQGQEENVNGGDHSEKKSRRFARWSMRR
ncbi:MAG: hypothetical protein HKN36_13515 [Hellea sp.]|nr:hypothetical protein [Hellea sp.]